MKYAIFWALLNIHTGIMVDGPQQEKPVKEYTPDECTKALVAKPIQHPDKDGNIKVFVCAAPDGTEII